MTSSADTRYSVPVDAESRGKARELLRRIYVENTLAFVRLTELLKPLKDRSRRQQIPHRYRLAFNYKLLGRGLGTWAGRVVMRCVYEVNSDRPDDSVGLSSGPRDSALSACRQRPRASSPTPRRA
jgi:hypothetical protein